MRIKMSLKDQSPIQKVQFTRNVVTAMTGNPNFVGPSPSLEALLELANDVEAKSNAVLVQRQAGQMATTMLRDAEAALELKLTQLANYVENASNGEEAKIESAGLVPRATPARVGVLPVVEALTATSGAGSGECVLSWQKVRRRNSYNVEKSLDPTKPEGWEFVGSSTKAKFTVKGLTSGTRYWFRVAAVGSAGQAPWSKPTTALAS